MRKRLQHALTIAAVLILVASCSKDDEVEIKLEQAPEIKSATEVSGTSFIANWASVKGAKYYKLEVSKNVDFTLPVDSYFDKQVSGTSLTISGLNASDKYFYRVKAGNSLGETDYSKVMSVRKINREVLYNVLWKGDEAKSNVTTHYLYDYYFNNNGNVTASFSGQVMLTGIWEWKSGSDVIIMHLSNGSPELNFLDVDNNYWAAYFSPLTDKMVHYNK